MTQEDTRRCANQIECYKKIVRLETKMDVVCKGVERIITTQEKFRVGVFGNGDDGLSGHVKAHDKWINAANKVGVFVGALLATSIFGGICVVVVWLLKSYFTIANP